MAREQQDLTGRSLASYKVVSLIGAGGMGQVYLARDDKLNRFVALKVLLPEIAGDAARTRRFDQEARAASALNHPNILTIYDIGSVDDTHYIATEYVEGETLRQRIDRGRIDTRTALDIACQIAGALAAAHDAKIIHRDIKPENIMIRQDGIVKVVDFGLAKLAGATLTPDARTLEQVQTAAGVIMGTVSYMSPEQARGSAIDSRADIWSLGVVLYEMLTGVCPFAAENIADALASIIHEEPPSLSGLPDNVGPIVSKALCKNADERYQTAADIYADLKRCDDDLAIREKLEGLRSEEQPGRSVDASGESSHRRTRKFVIAGIALFALLLTTGILYFGLRPHTAMSRSERKSLAILPFVNASQDPNSEYLSDGITENVINNLSNVSGLRVIPRTSSFRFKGDQGDIRDISAKLGVDNIITGDITQLGDKLIINVHLINASDGSQIWGNQYIRPAADILTTQAEIASEVARNLRVRLTENEAERLKKRSTDSPEAYQLYLEGQYAWNKHDLDDLRKSIDYYNRALEKDPNFALAYCGLSASYGVMGNDFVSPNEGFPKAKAYAARALELDSSLAEAHTAMAAVNLYYDWDLNEAGKHLATAGSLNPDFPGTILLEVVRLELMGRFVEAKAMRQRALELDPLSPLKNWVAGATSYFKGAYDDAIAQLEKTVQLEPNYYPTYQVLAAAYEQKGKYAKAIEVAQNGIDKAGRGPELVAALGYTHALEGRRDLAERALTELREMSRERYVSPYWTAVVYCGLNDKEQALIWLEKARQDRSASLLWLKVEPLFASMRDDARFQELVRRIGV
jgi:serine/threonine-protein kinase